MLWQLNSISTLLFISTGDIAGAKMMTISIPMENKTQTSPKGFSSSKCDEGNWIFSKS